jgi:hypothetical protein
MFQLQENLDAQVNGSQTVFTLGSPVSVVTGVVFDGASYIGTISITGSNQITLGDAPNTTLRVSYYSVLGLSITGGVPISDLRTYLQNHLDDSLPDVTDTVFINWCDWLNKFLWRKLFKLDPERFIYNSTISVGAGTDSYNLPGSFKTIDALGCGLFTVDNNGDLTDSMRVRTGAGSSKNGFYLNSTSIVITPKPSQAETLIFRYIPKINTLSATSDEMILDEEYLELLVNAMKKSFMDWDQDTFLESVYDQKFARNLSELFDSYRQESFVYDFVDTSISY